MLKTSQKLYPCKPGELSAVYTSATNMEDAAQQVLSTVDTFSQIKSSKALPREVCSPLVWPHFCKHHSSSRYPPSRGILGEVLGCVVGFIFPQPDINNEDNS